VTGRQLTCEERVDDELVKTEARYSNLWYQLDEAVERGDDSAEEQCRDELEPLNLETKRVLKLMFSWGGPSAWIEAELDGSSVVSLTYHFADWFDYAERDVSESEAPALWRLAEYYAELG
jgi:hypothetical protein